MLEIFRCTECGREVVVRKPGPMSPKEVARRKLAEMRPNIRGTRGASPVNDQLRDDIWAAISTQRTEIPRLEAPDRCPACKGETLESVRHIEQ